MDRTERMPDGLPRPGTIPGRRRRTADAEEPILGAHKPAGRFAIVRRHPILTGLLVLLALIALGAVFASALLKEPVRRRIEAQMNASLEGYTVRVPDLELHLWSLSLALLDLSVKQNANPDPPVIDVSRLGAGIHWRALLSLRLVADLEAIEPRLHIDKRQLTAEADDKVAVEDKGWQDAIEAIYPLKFNRVRIADGSMTYIDDPKRPVELTNIELVTTNIRNARSAKGTFPSPLQLTATVFDKGQLRVEGAADYLAEPNPSLRTEIDLTGVPLTRVAPVADDVGLQLKGGILSAEGDFQMVGVKQQAHLKRARIDDFVAEYVHAPGTATTKRAAEVAKTSAEVAKEDTVEVSIDELRLTNATLGVLNKDAVPAYRVFFDNADVKVLNVSNTTAHGRGWVMLKGRLMGSGPSDIWASFMADKETPDMNVSVQINDTEMRTMNDLFQAYGDFDVVEGKFAFFSQLSIYRGRVEGYVKPIFTDMNVFDSRQESGDSFGQKIYETVVGGIAKILRNRDEATATKARVRGDVKQPDLSVWEVVVNLVRNAFFDAIMPGLDKWRGRGTEPVVPDE